MSDLSPIKAFSVPELPSFLPSPFHFFRSIVVFHISAAQILSLVPQIIIAPHCCDKTGAPICVDQYNVSTVHCCIIESVQFPLANSLNSIPPICEAISSVLCSSACLTPLERNFISRALSCLSCLTSFLLSEVLTCGGAVDGEHSRIYSFHHPFSRIQDTSDGAAFRREGKDSFANYPERAPLITIHPVRCLTVHMCNQGSRWGGI